MMERGRSRAEQIIEELKRELLLELLERRESEQPRFTPETPSNRTKAKRKGRNGLTGQPEEVKKAWHEKMMKIKKERAMAGINALGQPASTNQKKNAET